MKYVFYALLLIAAILFGVFIGVGVLRDFGLVIGMFVLFPAVYIFGVIFIGRGKKEKPTDEDNEKKRISKWD